MFACRSRVHLTRAAVRATRWKSGKATPPPPSNTSFLGVFEYTEGTVDEIIERRNLQPPFSVCGTRKPDRLSFFHWDLNLSLFYDHLNPNLYLTFKDANGKVLGPVCYRGTIRTVGLKAEMGTRFQMGVLTPPPSGIPKMNTIPSEIRLDSQGYDLGVSLSGFGVVYSRFVMAKDDPLQGCFLTYTGVGNALGFTKVIGKHGCFQRLPYLYKGAWGGKERAVVLFWVLLYGTIWAAVITASLYSETRKLKEVGKKE